MPPAIDPDMVLMMNAKEGQPAYWRNGENGLEFVQWVAPVQTPDSRLQSAKDISESTIMARMVTLGLVALATSRRRKS
jgi:hypothetical protein